MAYPGYPQTSYPAPTYFCIDVECCATGLDHNARDVAQISLVDQYENVMLNLYIKPAKPVVSYLTPLTGLTAEMIDHSGMALQEAIAILRQYLPKYAVLVGQNIGKDVEWLGLKEGVDFQGMVDLSGLYRIWNPKFRSFSVFGQDHVAKVLFDWSTEGASHDAVVDAIKSIRLFNYYHSLQANPSDWEEAKEALLAAEPEPSFARRNPTFEGVCMGNRKTCRCGAPFLG